ncbi:MAG: endonuclease/exonuclease/phosphatase family protein, partial [Proteobacteria bacterium]|nr:endonuclease/exonuclease/phosphatase family protein [Pseudomonadota bacterium]
MRLMTWNINSIRLRIDLVARLTEQFRPDILCLQETKVIDDLFPRAALADMGYRHQAIRGMKGYNGVAILSRRPFAATGSLDWCRREDCRHVSATLKNGIEIHNFYVPSGGDIADAGTNKKFAHKLEFLRQVAAWCRAGKGKGESEGARRILVGDLNIAPLDNDVWSHRQMRNVVSHTEIEISHLERLRKAGSWIDAVRHFYGDDEKLYSWWS